MDADPPMSTAPLAAPETPRLPEGPRPFARWLTVLATLAVAGLFVAGIWARRAGGGAGLDRGRAAEARADRPSAEQRHPRLKYVEAAGLVIGLGAAGLLGTRRRRPRQAPPELPAPWPRGDLYAALVRCLFWSFLITTVVAAAMGVARHPPRAEEITLLVYVLGLAFLARLVFRRWGLSWRDSLGAPRTGAGVDLALTTLGAIGLCQAGAFGIGLAARLLGSRLAASDLPPLIDAAARLDLVLAVVGAVVLAPLAEEVLFRRAIFTRLRRGLAPGTAAVASALLFAVPHGYAPVGLAMMTWIGLVTAWAFHRTGSLWPCVAAHAFTNAIAIWASVV